jgi:cytosine/adenosine deaminase-related metal-dependent hydrolase
MAKARKMKEELIGRWILTGKGVVKGYLRVLEESVEEVCLGDPPSESSKVCVIPGFVNAHTHIGDSIAYPAPQGTVEELVGPPDGFKHRELRTRSLKEKSEAIRSASDLMARSGTTCFVDFREEGLEGIKLLSASLGPRAPRCVVLGRPLDPGSADAEIDSLLGSCDGIGMSALKDHPLDLLAKLSAKAKSAGKLFSIHASETVREDIDDILSLKPDFVVHMVKATDDDIAACVDSGVPIVVCPRSYEFFGLDLNIPRLLRAGATVGLGTDNGMISRPVMLDELQTAYRTSVRKGGISPLQTVNLATLGGRKVLNANGNIATETSVGDDLAVIRIRGEDPMLDLVTKTRLDDVLAVIRGGKLRRTENWTK